MKSRTSFCNGTLLKKDLTRFAPLWGLYLVGLLLGMILMTRDDLDYWFAANLAHLTHAMCVINLVYAAVAAQLLFGDLYGSRMCNALHALPIRRETQFVTHILSGLLFSLIPTVLFAVACLPVLSFSIVVDAWQLPLLWFAGANLQYGFFFALAVLSMFCAGSRVGAALIYSILNFMSYLAWFLVDMVYTPMLHGVVTQEDFFRLLCPVAQLSTTQLVSVSRRREAIRIAADGSEQYHTWGDITVPPEGWIYLGILAVIGVGFLFLALRMYKKRDLECAGDLMANRKLEPAFMVLYSLVAAALFQAVNQMVVGGRELMYLFLGAGLTVGWFTGRMLVERQVKVFRSGKNWLGLAALALALAASLFVTKLDPLGIEDWTPDAEDVRSVNIGIGYRGSVDLDTPEEIKEAIYFHELLLEEKLTDEEIAATQHIPAPEAAVESAVGVQTITIAEPQPVYRTYRESSSNVHIIYTLKNGWTVRRVYNTWLDTEQGQMLRKYMSTVESVFSNYSYIKDAGDLVAQADTVVNFHVNGHPLDEGFWTEEAVRELLECVAADCEAGTMAQYTNFHDQPVLVVDEDLSKGMYQTSFNVDIMLENDTNIHFDVYADSEHSLAWLEKTGIIEEIRESIENARYG